jgi:UDP-N-acetylmuramate dehydrogenase
VLSNFPEFVRYKVPLAPFTHFKLGGPAEAFVQPRTRDELTAVVRECFAQRIPFRVLGNGCNLLVRDEGVAGVVVRLSEAAFTSISVSGRIVTAGTGASVMALISGATRHGLAGLESLVGIPGTVGGALRTNAGDRSEQIGQYVKRVEVIDERGQVEVRERDELRFGSAHTLDDPVVIRAEFALDTDDADAIVKRMRRAWIQRKAGQPLSFQSACRVFHDPRRGTAASLIEQAGLAKTRVGGAEVSDRNANYIVAHPGATARDVLRLMELVSSRVRERFDVTLEPEIAVW